MPGISTGSESNFVTEFFSWYSELKYKKVKPITWKVTLHGIMLLNNK